MLNQLDNEEFLKLLLIMPIGFIRSSFMKKSDQIRLFLCDLASNSYGFKFNDILLSVMACKPETIEEI